MQQVPSIVLGVCLSCACLVCAGCPHGAGTGSAKTTTPPASTAAAGAIAPFKWRTLAKDTPSPDDKDPMDSIVGIIPGHFVKGSKDEQALQLGKLGSKVFSADLTSTAFLLKTSDPVPQEVTAWDYDRDGVDDLVFSPILSKAMEEDIGKSDAPDGAAVFGLDGKLRGIVPCDMSSTVVAGDFDGDHFKDLVVLPLISMAPVDAPVYGKEGNRVGYLKLAQHALGGIAADVDGDGQDDLVRLEIYPGQLIYYGLGHPLKVLGRWYSDHAPSVAARVSGGNTPDLITGRCIWNADKNEVAEWGVDGLSPEIAPSYIAPVAIVQPPGSPQRFIALMPAIASSPVNMGDTLVCFKADGRLVHREVLPGQVLQLVSFESGGQTYLVAQLEHELLIYP